MFLKRKRFYTLGDIKNHIVYTPLIFLVILFFLSILISFSFLSFEEKNKIQLLIQKDSFSRKNILKNYIKDVKYKISSNLDLKEDSLKNTIFELKGYLNSYNLNKKQEKDFKTFLSKLEKNFDIEFLIINTKNNEILHGEDIFLYLKNKIEPNIKTNLFIDSMIRNLKYNGNDSVIYWLEKGKREVRLSYFINFKEKKVFIGTFSRINDMKLVMSKIILKAISKSNDRGYFVFYNRKNHLLYNYDGKSSIKKVYNLKKDKDFLKFTNSYIFKEYEYEIFFKGVYVDKQIKEIKKEYKLKKIITLAIILLICLFLIATINIFTDFLSQIFQRYNKRVDRKNILLKKLKERYELGVVATNDGLWDLDLDTNRIFFSDKWLDMFGYDKNDIKTFHDWLQLVHKEDRENVLDSFNDHLLSKSQNFICEYRLKDKKGNFKWVLVRGKAFHSKNKNRMLMMSMDIDRRMRLSKELRNIKVLTNYGRIVIFRWKNDKDLKVRFVSNSIENYGFTIDEFLNGEIGYYDFVHPEDVKELKFILKNAIYEDLGSFTHVYRVIDRYDNVKWVYNRTILIKDDYGKVKSLYGYLNDITQIKLNEEELKQRVEQEVKKNTQKDRLLIQQNKMAAMGEMLGNIAHQWRQPLNNINLLIHFIRDNYGNLSKEELNEITLDAKLQCEYMSQTIDDFRKFYQPSKDREIFDIKASITQASKIVKSYFEKNLIELEIEAVNAKINSYKNEFEQVIVNILNNAVDAAVIKRKNEEFIPKVKINVYEEINMIIIDIINNCGNIDIEVIDRIFEPYFTTKFESKGTGIGLYMSKVIIENNMNGKIEVFNEKDGVKFTIRLFN